LQAAQELFGLFRLGSSQVFGFADIVFQRGSQQARSAISLAPMYFVNPPTAKDFFAAWDFIDVSGHQARRCVEWSVPCSQV
jgi:hypothetical protein